MSGLKPVRPGYIAAGDGVRRQNRMRWYNQPIATSISSR